MATQIREITQTPVTAPENLFADERDEAVERMERQPRRESSVRQAFNDASTAFAARPNPLTFVELQRASLALLTRHGNTFATASAQPAPPVAPWRPVEDPAAFAGGFKEIRVVCDTDLDDEEVFQVAGCLGYALREILAGEDLSEPTVYRPSDGDFTLTVLDFAWDSRSSIRTNPDPAWAFEVAKVYVYEGTRARTTTRVGPVGSRLVEGIGRDRCNVSFFVR
jgi:hypothetical protein